MTLHVIVASVETTGAVQEVFANLGVGVDGGRGGGGADEEGGDCEVHFCC
jgi:hypothetical protein